MFVTEVAEDYSAERSGEKADGVGDESGEDGVELAGAGCEEHLGEDQGRGGSVEEELVPLDDGAGHRCPDDLLEPGGVGVRVRASRCVLVDAHAAPSVMWLQ